MSEERAMPTAFAADAAVRLNLLQQAVKMQPNSAKLLYKLADEYAERGDDDAYAETYRAAFRIRQSLRLLRQIGAPPGLSQAEFVRRRARPLVARGLAYAPILAALAASEAILGDRDAARFLVDYERFFRCQRLPAPEGFSEPEFHAQLAGEVRTKLRYFDATAANAIRKGWRHYAVLDMPTPATRTLRAMLQASIADYIAKMRRDDHPFAAARPDAFKLASWAIVSNGESRHVPHVHGQAWLTGVYYVVQPPVSRAPGSRRGWLRVGAPVGYGVGPDQGWDERLVAPAPGSLVLMPGYFFHDTQPMEVDEERICIAFDVVPAELADNIMIEDV
ncbi:MAG TPA: putative 2OG-Fe(II) oxygenase [Pseudolabrys sp.]